MNLTRAIHARRLNHARYDLLGNIIGVTQNAQAASGSQQTRTYTFDMIGRLTSETNPETGASAITYAYDTLSNDPACGSVTSAGDLLKKIDAMNNVTCYTYDVLHRVAAITYPSGAYAAATDQKHYLYDAANVNGVAMANTKARLAEAYTCTASCTTHKTDLGFSYTARGQLSDVWQQTPDSAGWHHVNATYWEHGALNVLNGGTNPLPGLPAIKYGATGAGVDGKGRITQVTAATGQNPVNSVTWNSGDQVTGVTFGSLDGDTYQYDPNTGRMTQFKLNMSTSSQTGTLTWNKNGTVQQLQIVDTINSGNNQTCTYGYDDLTRITSANCGTLWSQTFGFDPFGNLSKSGSAQFLPVYTGTAGAPGTTPTNQYYQITGGGAGVSNYHDTNGNLINDVTHNYTWDADGNMLSVDSSTVTMIYDALDRMIEQTRGSSHSEIVYGPYGTKLALMNGQTLVSAFVKLPGGARAVYKSTGLTYYRHADHLGNSRLATKTTRLRYYQAAYAPYGEEYATAGDNPDLAFTDENQDTIGAGWTTNLYDFLRREYRTAHGRWTQPDPAGLGAVDPTNPQTWNRFSYVLNDPVALVDLFGDYSYDCSTETEFKICVVVTGNPDPNPSRNCSTPGACSPNSGQGGCPPGQNCTGSSQGGGSNGSIPGQCSVAVSCHPTQVDPNKVHCGVTTTANGISTRYDAAPTDHPSGKPGQGVLGSTLVVNVQQNTGTPPGDKTIFNSSASCGVVSCIGQTANGINNANAPYSLLPMLVGAKPFSSNTAAQAMTKSCGLSVQYPSNAPGADN